MIAALVAALLATNVFASPTKPDQVLVDNIQAVLDTRKQARIRAETLESQMKAIEREIGLRDEQDRPLPLNLQVEEYAKKLLGLGNETLEKYARASKEYKSAQQELRSLSEQAIKMATAAYKPAPAISSGDIASGPPKPVTSDDIPSYIGNSVTYAPVFSERVPDGKSGSTDDAGKVLIGPGAFDSPGKLAFTLYHEGEHFERLLTPGLDLRNNPAEEVLTRTKQRPLLKSTFGLTGEEITRFDRVLASERIRAKKWSENLSQGLDPYKKSHQPAFPGNVRPLWLEDGVGEEVDKILARAKELRDQEIDEAAQRRREEDAERARRAAAEWAMDQYRAAASDCGLTPMMTQGGQTVGFKAGESANVYFTEPVTLDQAKAGILMTRACWAGEAGQSEDQSCTDALGAMRANWGDEGFKHGLELDADAGNIDGCLRAIREAGDPPKDKQALNKRVSSYWRDWKAAAKRRELETMRAIWRGQEESSRRARGDAEERSGRVHDGTYDLTPARRALDQARGSHF